MPIAIGWSLSGIGACAAGLPGEGATQREAQRESLRTFIRDQDPRTPEDAIEIWRQVNAVTEFRDEARDQQVVDRAWGAEEKRNLLSMLKEFVQGGQADLIGDFDALDEWPDCVAVGAGDDWWGSGVLVASNVVVTAAHNRVKPREETLLQHVFFGPDVRKPGTRVAIVGQPHLYPNPAGPAATVPDLAVLILAEPAPQHVEPRAFAAPNALDDPRVHAVKVVGYGGDSPASGVTNAGKRRRSDVPLHQRLCTAGDLRTLDCYSSFEFVAGRKFLNRGVCPGDSGGPAYVRDPETDEWSLAGITRRTTGPGTRACGDLSVHIRLDTEDFMQWIRAIPGGTWP
ncbi:MAG: trypsin-like serine protease [Phycisphaerales bacterium]